MSGPGIFLDFTCLKLSDGNATDALILGAIVQQASIKQIERQDGAWLPLPHAELAALVQIPVSTIRKGISRLIKRGLIRTLTFGCKGVRTVHIQVLHEDICALIKRPERTDEAEAQTPETDITDGASVQNEHLTTRQTPETDTSANDQSEQLVGVQVSKTSISHSQSVQNGHLPGGKKIPLNNSPKELQQSAIRDTGKLIVESWVMAHPEGKKPKGAFNPDDLRLAEQLAADDFTPEDAFKLTTEKWVNRTRKYEFRYLAEDLRKRRKIVQQVNAVTTAAFTDDEPPRQQAEPEPTHASLLVTGPNEKTWQENWDAGMSQVKLQLDAGSFGAWLQDAKPLRFEDDTYIVAVRSDYARNSCEFRFSPMIKRVLRDYVGKSVELRFEVAASGEGRV